MKINENDKNNHDVDAYRKHLTKDLKLTVHYHPPNSLHVQFPDTNESNTTTSNATSTGTDDTSSPVSPIGETLKHSEEFTREHDADRTIMSESFCIGLEQSAANAIDQLEAIDIRIFFPNGSALQFNVENGLEASADDLLKLISQHLNINDFAVAEESLAIWLVSPLLEIQLKSYHIPYEIFQKWPAFLRRFTTASEDEILLNEPLLVIRRNVLLTLDREIELVDKYEQLTELLYFDARDNYLSGRYPVDIETALDLVGLQLVIEFGPYNGKSEDALNLIYDTLNELAPTTHIKAIRSFHLFGLKIMECKKGLENRVIDEYRTASKHYGSNYECRKAFLTILRNTPFYGSAFYSGTIDMTKLISEKSEYAIDAEAQKQCNGRIKRKSANSHRRPKTVSWHGNLFDRLRHLFIYHHNHGESEKSRQEILIGINHGYITLIDPKQQKLLEVLQDTSSTTDRSMSLNEKISLFCVE